MRVLLLLVAFVLGAESLSTGESIVKAKRSDPQVRKRLIPPANADVNQGTTFVFSFLNSHLDGSGDNYTEILSVTVTNPGTQAANVQIVSPFPGFSTINVVVSPQSSTLIPITPAAIQTDYKDPYFDVIIVENKTLTLTSDRPVFAVGSNTHSDLNNMDKFTLIPVCQLGTEYHVVGDESGMMGRLVSSNIVTAVAIQDNTNVTIVDYSTAGPKSFVLNKGQQVTLVTYWYTTNIAIFSDKPVAVLSGAVCGFGYYNEYVCNHEALMLYPIDNYGLSIPYYKFMPEDYGEFMVLMQQDNTDLYFNGDLIFKNLSAAHTIIVGTPTGAFMTASKPIYGVAVGSTSSKDQSAPYFSHLPSEQSFITGPIEFPVALADNEKLLTNYVRLVTKLPNIGQLKIDDYIPSGLLYTRMGRSTFYFVDVVVQSGTHKVSMLNSGTFTATVVGYGELVSYSYTPAVDLKTSSAC